jgi:hypothetical protein
LFNKFIFDYRNFPSNSNFRKVWFKTFREASPSLFLKFFSPKAQPKTDLSLPWPDPSVHVGIDQKPNRPGKKI